MQLFEIINNNFKYDIWGNYQMSRQLGRLSGYSFLAKKSWALAKAMVMNRRLIVNNTMFFDTWNG